jgi:hypothetical protein
MDTYTITEDQIRNIHNAICDLDMRTHKMTDIISPILLEDLTGIVVKLRDAMDPIMKLKNQRWEERFDYYDTIKRMHSFKSVWSIYEISNFDRPSTMQGKVLKYEGNQFELPENHTWFDLYAAADHLINISGDGHHMFIEDFYVKGDGVLSLCTGS